MSNGETWEVKCFANCNSLNVLYFLVCNFCQEVTNIGKTDDCRERTNNHISGCRHGRTTDKFDNHVYACAPQKGMELVEPYFKLYFLMVCSNYHKLLSHENALHARGLDTINKPQTTNHSSTHTWNCLCELLTVVSTNSDVQVVGVYANCVVDMLTEESPWSMSKRF